LNQEETIDPVVVKKNIFQVFLDWIFGYNPPPAPLETPPAEPENPPVGATSAGPGSTTSTMAGTSPTPRSDSLVMETAINTTVCIHTEFRAQEDAEVAAMGIMKGMQQIVYLEHANQQQSVRIVDFLYGVCYALEGNIEKVGDKVYMFAPKNVKFTINNKIEPIPAEPTATRTETSTNTSAKRAQGQS